MMRFLLLLIPLSVFLVDRFAADTKRFIDYSSMFSICNPLWLCDVVRTNTEQCRRTLNSRTRKYPDDQKPDVRETICEKSPYPSNYAVVARTRLNTASSSVETDNNAWIIAG